MLDGIRPSQIFTGREEIDSISMLPEFVIMPFSRLQQQNLPLEQPRGVVCVWGMISLSAPPPSVKEGDTLEQRLMEGASQDAICLFKWDDS